MAHKQVSIKTDKSILVREIYRLKRELVAETHRADANLWALRELWDRYEALAQKVNAGANPYE